MAYRPTDGERADHVSPNRRHPNRTPTWMAVTGTAAAMLMALTVPLVSTFPAGAAVPKGSVPANWNSDPNASCGSWHQAPPPGAGYVGTVSLSGGGGGIGGADQFPPFDYTLPAGGQGGLVSTGVVTEGSTVSVFTACGGRNQDTNSGGAGYGGGGSAGTGTQEDGYDGGSGGGASILCLGSVTSSSGCTTPLVIAGGGGGTGAGYDCGTADGWGGSGGTAGTGSRPTPTVGTSPAARAVQTGSVSPTLRTHHRIWAVSGMPAVAVRPPRAAVVGAAPATTATTEPPTSRVSRPGVGAGTATTQVAVAVAVAIPPAVVVGGTTASSAPRPVVAVAAGRPGSTWGTRRAPASPVAPTVRSSLFLPIPAPPVAIPTPRTAGALGTYRSSGPRPRPCHPSRRCCRPPDPNRAVGP